MKKSVLLLLALTVFSATFMRPISVNAQTEAVDLSLIDELTEQAIADKIFPGATVLVKQGNDVLYNKSFGHAQLYDMGELFENPIEATNDTVYDLASVTKVMATTQAIMMLVHRGELDLDKPVAEYMPDFGRNGKDQVTARDLLTHTSGLTPWEPTFLYGSTRAEEKEYINNLSLEYETGKAMKYSDFSFMTLAFLVEAISGQEIHEYLEDNMYGPLGLSDTKYTPLDYGIEKNRIAATSWGNPYEWRMSNEAEYPGYGYDTSKDAEAFLKFNGWRNYTLIGEVNDGNAGMANGGIAGHAGLFSTATDLSVIGDVLLNGGTLNGITFYDQAVIDEFTAADAERFGRGLGWQVDGNRESSGYVGRYASGTTFSHAGFTGTQVIFDSAHDLQVIILTNKQNIGHDNGNYKSPYKYSRDVMNLVYESIDPTILENAKAALQTVVDTEVDESLYTPSSYAAYQALVDEAVALIANNEAKVADVNALAITLQEAIDTLVLRADTSVLEDKIKGVDTYDLDLYTEESVEALAAVLEEAKALVLNLDATQADVDAMVATLIEAYDALELKDIDSVNYDALNTALDKAAKVDRKLYAKESLDVLDKAVAAGKAVIENKGSQAEADQASANIEAALKGLKSISKDVNTGITLNSSLYLGVLAVSALAIIVLRRKSIKR